MTVRSLVVVAGTALAVGAAAEALGCSCQPPRSVETELRESAAVLEGVVVRTNSLMCGLGFRGGERWLVFAHSQPLRAGLCGKSGHLTLSQRSPFDGQIVTKLGKPTWVGPR
jgi:hypothetical protein